MGKVKRWKLLMPLTLAVLFIAAMASGAWAKVTITGAKVGLTQQSYPATGDFVSDNVTGDIVITYDANSTDKTTVEAGTYITLTAPSGYKFVAASCPSATAVDCNATHLADSHAFIASEPIFSTSSYNATAADFEFGYTKDADGINRVTAIQAYVSSSLSADDSKVTIDLDHNVAAPRYITLQPLNVSDKKHETGKQLTVTVNDGSSSASTVNLGSLNFLRRPDILYATGSGTTVDVHFPVDMDLSTIEPGDFALNTGAVESVQKDPSDLTSVTLVVSSAITPGTTTVAVNGTIASAADFLDGVQNINASSSNVVTINDPSSSIQGVTANKSKVGANATTSGTVIPWSSLAPQHKVAFTVIATSGQQIKAKILNANSEVVNIASNNATTGSNLGVNASASTAISVDDTNDILSLTMPTAGSVTINVGVVDATLEDSTTTAFPLGQETTATLRVSADNFATYTDANLTIDRKAPSVITSGDSKASAPTRTSVVLNFDEALKPDSAITATNYTLQKDVNGTWTTQSSMIKVASLSDDGKTVTLTTTLLSTASRYRVKLESSITDTVLNGVADGTVTNSFRTGDVDITSISVENKDTGSNSVGNDGTLKVTAVAATGQELYARAVDADNKELVLSDSSAALLTESQEGKYTTGSLTLVSDLSGTTSLIVQVSSDNYFIAGVSESDPITVDNTRPKIASAANTDAFTVGVLFSEDMKLSSLTIATNWGIDKGIQVLKVDVDPTNLKKAVLTVTELTSGTLYTVDVDAREAKDLANNQIATTDVDTIGLDKVRFTATVTATCDADHPDLCTTEADCTGAGLNWCDGVCQVAPCSAPEPLPTGQNVTELTGADRANAPVNLGSVVTGGDQMELALNFPAYEAAVDEYAAVQLPDGTLYFVAPDNSLTTDIVAYAVGVTDATDVSVCGSFAVCNMFGNPSVPAGQWTVYSLVVPTNGGDFTAIDWATGNYDLPYYTFDVTCP